MSSSSKPPHEECPFGKCELPTHTYNYTAQFFYLCLAYIFLIRDNSEFTATNVVLFIIPIAIDLIFSNRCTGIYRIVQLILYLIVAICSIISLGAVFGFFVVTNESFTVNPNALLLSDFSVSKKLLARLLFFAIFTPCILSVGTKTTKDLEAKSQIHVEKGAQS